MRRRPAAGRATAGRDLRAALEDLLRDGQARTGRGDDASGCSASSPTAASSTTPCCNWPTSSRKQKAILQRAIGIYNRLVGHADQPAARRSPVRHRRVLRRDGRGRRRPRQPAQLYDRAFQEYKKVFDNFPDSGRVGEAVAKMANYYYQQKDYARAIDIFETVLADHPDAKFLDVILFNYGRCLYRMDRKERSPQTVRPVDSPTSPKARWPRTPRRFPTHWRRRGFRLIAADTDPQSRGYASAVMIFRRDTQDRFSHDAQYTTIRPVRPALRLASRRAGDGPEGRSRDSRRSSERPIRSRGKPGLSKQNSRNTKTPPPKRPMRWSNWSTCTTGARPRVRADPRRAAVCRGANDRQTARRRDGEADRRPAGGVPQQGPDGRLPAVPGAVSEVASLCRHGSPAGRHARPDARSPGQRQARTAWCSSGNPVRCWAGSTR